MNDVPYMRREVEWTSPTGVKTTLHSIGDLAYRLGRTSKCIRHWEISGVIPDTPFRNKNKQRLYSAEHIEVIVNAAEKYHIRNGSRIADTAFSRTIFKEFKRLNTYFFGESKEVKDEYKEK